MLQTCWPVVVLLALIGCSSSDTGNGTSPPAANIVPDGDAVGDEPVDPAVEAEQRKLAQLNDLGVDLLSVSISSPAELEGAALRTPGAGGAPFLATVTSKLLIGLRDADYVLVFDPGRTEPLVPNLRGTEDAPLIAIQRIDRAVPTCTTWVSTAAQLVGYGRRIGKSAAA